MSATMTKTLAIAALAVSSSAHMVMRQPVPFVNSIGGFGLNNPDNSPLAESGSNYPCHMSGDYSTDSWAQMPQGSAQTLKFLGSAVHGGGSCQISITYDLTPSKTSVFKVIHSIEGGCPARNVAGNLPANSYVFQTQDEYSFSIPPDLPTGKAVLAWTWFNRIGNREMYMNCAPIEITGSDGDTSAFNSLPDIMVANIGEKQCKVAEGTAVAFPNPGASVEQNKRGQFQDVSGQPACSYNWMAGDGPGSIDDDNISGDSPGGGDDTPSPDPTPNFPGGVFIPTTPDPPATSTGDAGNTTFPVSPSSDNGSPGDPGVCTPGMYKCMGSTFSQCANGEWSVAMPLAPGTSCTSGIGMNLDVVSISKKSKRTHPRAFQV